MPSRILRDLALTLAGAALVFVLAWVRPGGPALPVVTPGWDDGLPAWESAESGAPMRWVEADGQRWLEAMQGPADRRGAAPLVIHLHGLADGPRPPNERGEDHRVGYRWLQPVGPMPMEGKHAWYGVRVSERREDALAAGMQDGAAAFHRFLDVALRRYPSPCPPIVTGFSQGALVALTATLERPERVSGLFGGAAYLPSALEPDAPRPFFPTSGFVHGGADPIIPEADARATFSRLRALGFPIVYRRFEAVEHEMSDAMHRQLFWWLDEATVRCVERAKRRPGPIGPTR